MTRLNTKYNWGQNIIKENPDLYRQLSDIYSDLANASNNKANKLSMTSNPSANSPENKEFDIGDIRVNSSTNTAWILTSRTSAEEVTWTQIT